MPHDFKKVTIEENAIVGAGTVILPGVTIGHGSLIWPGSFIHKDVAPETYIVTKLEHKRTLKPAPRCFAASMLPWIP